MQSFRQQSPEIPVVCRASHAGTRVALYGVVEIREFERVAQKEYRGVVTHEIPVTLIGVELYGKPTDITFGIGGSSFSGHG